MFDREILEFFQLRDNGDYLKERVMTLEREFWTNCNLLNSKSASDKYRELQ